MITIRSGILKNKRLQTPDQDVRPTSDKIRQAIFNVIMHGADMPSLSGANILDAFAGTGALGLEAISRGAAHGWFMEMNASVRKTLHKNLKLTDNITLLPADALNPPPAPHPMNFIFLDPPYGKNLASQAVIALDHAGWIDHQTVLVLEMSTQFIEPNVVGFRQIDQRTYGSTAIAFWHKT